MSSASYRLHALHLYNWGAFAGRHQASISPDNSAIIGPTGSGKTTLIDALMTLLCQHPRYNLASTGGHESDRDLVSYLRGASGPGHEGEGSAHLARQGRCVTGLAAQLRGADDDGAGDIWLGAILWLDGSSSAQADMGRRWFFAQGGGHSLDLWLEEHHSGGARALSRLVKNSDGLEMFSSKSAYLARVQRFFEIGPNAFTLLNRAAGLKQLNSIDEIFRDLVLDDHSAFDDALRVADSFDELAAIHAELELANRQCLALLPLRELAQQEARQQQALQDQRLLHAALPHWCARLGQQQWAARCADLQQQLNAQAQRISAQEQQLEQARQQEQTLLEAYLRAGGGDIELLRRSIATQQDQCRQRAQHWAQFQQLAGQIDLPVAQPFGAAQLAQLQAQAAPALAQLQNQAAALQEALEDAVAQERNAHAALAQLQDEITAVRQRPGSNLPPDFTQFRAQLAEQLRLAPDALPFVAELVEVPAAHQAWRGAIERALGAQRLRLLVPPQAMQAALAWVNQRHNRLHVRLLEVRAPASPARFWDDGFARLLTLKSHAHQGALRQLLAEQDRHCVASTEALQTTPHAMTREGLMSGRAQHFDKQDQRRIDQDWMTGFDNRDRLAQLQERLQAAQGQWETLQKQKLLAQSQQALEAQKAQSWQTLQGLHWSDIDQAGAQAELQQLQTRVAALLDPQSGTVQAQAAWQAAQQHGQAQAQALLRLQTAQATWQERQASAQTQERLCRERLAATPAPPGLDTLHGPLAALCPPGTACEELATQERQALASASERLDRLGHRLALLHKDIIRQMAAAQREDRGALTDHPQEVEALAHYLQRLQRLQEEDLPAKRARFQDYLNQASDQGVSTLLSGIEAQVAEITERIDQLNQTLARVDFHSGRYLQLVPQPVLHPCLQQLHQARAQLRSERLQDDGGQRHYQALRAMVELLREHASNRRTKAAQALLDARYRLQFAVHVLDRATGQVLERRTGSQGGSGGEKEIIASYVLTASLSYALCPPGRSQPLFCTIVLDEAFSKSSQAVAARIIQALQEFGLHALFVTPNKELRLLRQHTRSAVLVHRRGAQALLANMGWEEIAARAAGR